jgi:hypothetical protein
LKTRDIGRGRGEGEQEGAGKNNAAEQGGVQGRTRQARLADRADVRRGSLPCAFFPSPQPTRQIFEGKKDLAFASKEGSPVVAGSFCRLRALDLAKSYRG